MNRRHPFAQLAFGNTSSVDLAPGAASTFRTSANRWRAAVCLALLLPAGCAGMPPRKQSSSALPLHSSKAELLADSVEVHIPAPGKERMGRSLPSLPLTTAQAEEEAQTVETTTTRKIVLASGLTIAAAEETPADPATSDQQKVEPNSAGEAALPAIPDSPPADGPILPPTDESLILEKNGPAAYTLNLGDVIALADAQNPNVMFARERINEAYALVERAEVLWVPSLRTGFNFNHHDGNVQSVAGQIQEVSKSSWYGGLGAFGVGSNSPVIPGLVAQFQMTDAIFQPRIARHQAASRQYNATAVRNDTLRSTSLAYLELVRAEHSFGIAMEAFGNTQKLVDVTEQFAKTGQGLQSDYERMLTESALRRTDAISREEGARVASARLAQFLHADPSVPIVSGEPGIVPFHLMDHKESTKAYIVTGLSRRPELAEQQQLVCEAVERLNREKFAPLIPSVLLGMSYGGMGGGTGSSLANSAGRLDMDAVAFWEIRNLGFGEKAARDQMSSGIRQAQQRQLAVLDQVAREVTEAHTQVNERERRIAVARDGVIAAEQSYAMNLQRIENIQGLPIESLQAVQALANARQSYLNAVVDYNIAQIELIRATGWFESR